VAEYLAACSRFGLGTEYWLALLERARLAAGEAMLAQRTGRER